MRGTESSASWSRAGRHRRHWPQPRLPVLPRRHSWSAGVASRARPCGGAGSSAPECGSGRHGYRRRARSAAKSTTPRRCRTSLPSPGHTSPRPGSAPRFPLAPCRGRTRRYADSVWRTRSPGAGWPRSSGHAACGTFPAPPPAYVRTRAVASARPSADQSVVVSEADDLHIPGSSPSRARGNRPSDGSRCAHAWAGRPR